MMKHLIILCLIIVPVSIATYLFIAHALPVKSIGSLTRTNAVTNTNAVTTDDHQDLINNLNTVIEKYQDLSIAVSLTDLDISQTYNAGAIDTTFKGASTIKVLTAVYYMHQVENGKASLSSQINGVSAQTLLQHMIQDSDNSAWASITDYLGSGNIQSYAQSIGLASFQGYDYNMVKASDYVKLLVKLYDGELITADHCATLYSFMQNTDNETLIPAALPSGAVAYHKWGDLWGNLHDIAIVQYEGHSFALVIFTNNPDGTSDLITTQTTAIKEITETAIIDLND